VYLSGQVDSCPAFGHTRPKKLVTVVFSRNVSSLSRTIYVELFLSSLFEAIYLWSSRDLDFLFFMLSILADHSVMDEKKVPRMPSEERKRDL
jgi:hypothetical protein